LPVKRLQEFVGDPLHLPRPFLSLAPRTGCRSRGLGRSTSPAQPLSGQITFL
jgi:hypothetical protein